MSRPTVPECVPAVGLSVWNLDAGMQKALNELSTTPSIDIGEQVQLTILNTKILEDSDASSHLVTRKEQRDVHVTDVAFKISRAKENFSKENFVVAIRGSPGIGKSWTSLFYIQKLMQQSTAEQRPIIFQPGKSTNRKTYLIMPPDATKNKKEWTVYLLKGDAITNAWYDCSIIDLVIDPPHFPKGEIPIPMPLIGAQGHLFIPASLDDRHL